MAIFAKQRIYCYANKSARWQHPAVERGASFAVLGKVGVAML